LSMAASRDALAGDSIPCEGAAVVGARKWTFFSLVLIIIFASRCRYSEIDKFEEMWASWALPRTFFSPTFFFGVNHVKSDYFFRY
jgi:hypothetical protein